MLIGALDDQSALVRRAVMVSLSEHFLMDFPFYESLIERFTPNSVTRCGGKERSVTLIPRLVSPMMRGGAGDGKWSYGLSGCTCKSAS